MCIKSLHLHAEIALSGVKISRHVRDKCVGSFVCTHTLRVVAQRYYPERCPSDLLSFYPEWAFYCVPSCPAAQTTAI